jgi:hypothetical protein
MNRQWAKLSQRNLVKTLDYMLKRIDVLTQFPEDGRICVSNKAERELRGIALGRTLPVPVAGAQPSC